MNDKTAIEKAREALKEIANQEVGTWDKPVPFSVLYRRSVDIAREALAALDAEKPGEDVESCLSKMFRDIREIGYITEPLRLTNESHAACVNILVKFAESYHADQCAKCKALPEPPCV